MTPPEPTSSPAGSRRFLPLWLWPIVLGMLTFSGLLSALVSDGWGDAWSWVALGAPVAVMGWYALPRKRTTASAPR